MTKEDYERNLEENLANLVKRMKNGSYHPNPTRRVYIPKETKGKMRPLGISCYEDKLVENAIAQILEQIYEPKFYKESFGFRPNRNCHQAVREIIEMVQYRKTDFVVEADIRGFFDNVDHEWLMKMLSHDMADRRFLGIIEKFLKAGIMENGRYLDSERGTPQDGYAKLGIVSPMQSRRLCKECNTFSYKYGILSVFTLHSIPLITVTARTATPSGHCSHSNPADWNLPDPDRRFPGLSVSVPYQPLRRFQWF